MRKTILPLAATVLAMIAAPGLAVAQAQPFNQSPTAAPPVTVFRGTTAPSPARPAGGPAASGLSATTRGEGSSLEPSQTSNGASTTVFHGPPSGAGATNAPR